MYDIEIKKGQCFRYDLWFGGEPPPTVIWERKDGVINAETDPARYWNVCLFLNVGGYGMRDGRTFGVSKERGYGVVTKKGVEEW